MRPRILGLRAFSSWVARLQRVALQNAASIAGLLLTTDCAITEVKEKKAKAAAGHDHGDDY